MDWYKRIRKAKLRKKKLDIVLLIKHYRRTSLGRRTNKDVRNDVVKNHFSRKGYLTVLREKDKLLQINGVSDRVNDIIERL